MAELREKVAEIIFWGDANCGECGGCRLEECIPICLNTLGTAERVIEIVHRYDICDLCGHTRNQHSVDGGCNEMFNEGNCCPCVEFWEPFGHHWRVEKETQTLCSG